jgi:hypothetical protein
MTELEELKERVRILERRSRRFRNAGIGLALFVGLLLVPTLAEAQSLAEQKICADAARAYFRENFKPDPSGGSSASYVNHFNVRLGKCLVETTSTTLTYKQGGQVGGYILTKDIVDALDSATGYGGLTYVSAANRMLNCWFVYDNKKTECKTVEEFDKGTALLMVE